MSAVDPKADRLARNLTVGGALIVVVAAGFAFGGLGAALALGAVLFLTGLAAVARSARP